MLSSPLTCTIPVCITKPVFTEEDLIVFSLQESSSKNILVRFRGREPISWQDSILEKREDTSRTKLFAGFAPSLNIRAILKSLQYFSDTFLWNFDSSDHQRRYRLIFKL